MPPKVKENKEDKVMPEQTEEGVFIPDAVKAQAKEADKLQTELITGQPAPEKKPEDEGIPEKETKLDETKSPEKDVKAPDDGKAPEHPAAKKEGDKWAGKSSEEILKELKKSEHKFSVLQGKYDTEIKGAQGGEINELKTEIADLKNAVATLNMAKKPDGEKIPPAHPGDEKPDGADLKPLDLSEYEDYGEEMKNAIQAINAIIKSGGAADQTDQKTLKALIGRVEKAEKTAIKSDQDEFFSGVTDAIPVWRAINDEKEWKDFLNTAEPLTGAPYQAILNHARDHHDVARAVKVFKAFPKFQAYNEYHSYQAKAAGGDGGSSNLESQLTPDGGAGASLQGREKELGRKTEIITTEQFTTAVKKAATGLMTEKDFDELANKYQLQQAQAVRDRQTRARPGAKA